MKATSQDYYDSNPSIEHLPGDIWADLPTHGVIPIERVTGLIITPACDLSNNKVETLTYLPIVPVRLFLSGFSTVRECKRELIKQVRVSTVEVDAAFNDGYDVPRHEQLTLVADRIREILGEDGQPSDDYRTAGNRALAGLSHLIALRKNGFGEIPGLKSVLGAGEWNRLVRDCVTNRRLDTHFLPADRLIPQYSAVPEHSVVLFRFPLCAPLAILDMAQAVSEQEWAPTMADAASVYPIARAFASKRPLKKATLRAAFVPDLVTRYTNSYSRIGSPDFSESLIKQFIEEVDGTV